MKKTSSLTNAGIQLEGGNFPENASLVIKTVDVAKDEGKTVVTTIAEQEYDKEGKVYIFDISVESEGVKVQPNGKVKI